MKYSSILSNVFYGAGCFDVVSKSKQFGQTESSLREDFLLNKMDLVRFVMCTLVSTYTWRSIYLHKGIQSLVTRVHMTNLTRSNKITLDKQSGILHCCDCSAYLQNIFFFSEKNVKSCHQHLTGKVYKNSIFSVEV